MHSCPLLADVQLEVGPETTSERLCPACHTPKTRGTPGEKFR